MPQYGLALRYFSVMTLLVLISGLWMFVTNTSLNVEGTSSYYVLKSFYGLLETVSPHLFSMAVLIFILTHFFAIVSGVKHKNFRLFSILFFLFMLLSNVSGFFIEESGVFFSLLKLGSTLLFTLFSFFALYKLFKIT
ncbi:MAG: hypothetical protein GQ531_08480 [Sulfurovum sp.]|nr:hypothetical protein [Sulfurovum sp.]